MRRACCPGFRAEPPVRARMEPGSAALATPDSPARRRGNRFVPAMANCKILLNGPTRLPRLRIMPRPALGPFFRPALLVSYEAGVDRAGNDTADFNSRLTVPYSPMTSPSFDTSFAGKSKRRIRGMLIVLLAFIITLAAVVANVALRRVVEEGRRAEVLLLQLHGFAYRLSALNGRPSVSGKCLPRLLRVYKMHRTR